MKKNKGNMEHKYEVLTDFDATHKTNKRMRFSMVTEGDGDPILIRIVCPNDKKVFAVEELIPNFKYTCPYCSWEAFLE